MRLVATLFVSVDGVVQGPGGPDEDRSGGFDRGGWLAPYGDDDPGRLVVEHFARAGAFLLGRRTYEIFAGHWPQQLEGNPIADALNRLPEHVVSSTLRDPGWAGTDVLGGDLATGVSQLKQQPGRDLQVHGSPTLLTALLGLGLVDELRLFVIPVVVGAGHRIFADGSPHTALRLLDSSTTSSGVVLHHTAATFTISIRSSAV